ncbi:MAG: flagellar basal body P-ring formation chaperone FlgA [Trichlorobacter sp.]|jgi:flagella basal body P-ring formation protein FlgA
MSYRTLWLACLLVLLVCVHGNRVHAAGDANGQLLSEQEIRAAVDRFLVDRLAGRGWEVAVRQLSVPQGVRLPKGVRDLELIAPAAWDGWGPVSIVLLVRVNGQVKKNLSLRLQVDASTEMVVAARQLLAGTVLAADDLQLQKRDVSQAGGLHVREINAAVGKKLKTMVRAGAPVKSNQLANVPVIRSGQLVTIVAEHAGFRITVTGRAKSSGGVGDLVRVENISSRKEFSARVVDAATVEAGF